MCDDNKDTCCKQEKATRSVSKDECYLYDGQRENRTERGLLIGFTTGSAASAAAKAGVLALLGRLTLPEQEAGRAEPSCKNMCVCYMDIPCPEEGRLRIPIRDVKVSGESARALVIKDGGDDPDATHRAKIICDVIIDSEGPDGLVNVRGGRGVGVVTLPGLSVARGEPAINPGPMRQIKEAVLEGMAEAGGRGSVTVTVHVPDGERIALSTMNLRLGIVGGISILGTRGTVIPFSNEAYESTITMGMDVAISAKIDTVALSTGGKSEKFLKNYEPLPEQAFVQIADFFAFSMKEAAHRDFARIVVACFFGKLVKMAQGFEYTHAKESRINFDMLADWCMSFGMRDVNGIRKANTAREAFDIITGSANPEPVFAGITSKALDVACRFAGKGQSVSYYLFDMDGELVCRMDGRPYGPQKLISGWAKGMNVSGMP